MRKQQIAKFLLLTMLTGVMPANMAMAKSYDPPRVVKANAKAENKIEVRWTKNKGAKKYIVYQKEEGAKYKRIKTLRGTKYVTKALKKDKVYYFCVKTVYGNGDIISKKSNTVFNMTRESKDDTTLVKKQESLKFVKNKNGLYELEGTLKDYYYMPEFQIDKFNKVKFEFLGANNNKITNGYYVKDGKVYVLDNNLVDGNYKAVVISHDGNRVTYSGHTLVNPKPEQKPEQKPEGGGNMQPQPPAPNPPNPPVPQPPKPPVVDNNIYITGDLDNVKTVKENERVTLTVVAKGSNLKYQWYKNDSPLEKETSNSLTITSAKKSDEGSYKCKISNDYGYRHSKTLALKVTTAEINKITITKDLEKNLNMKEGENNLVSLTVNATGKNLTYQWFKSDVAGDVAIVGETKNTLNLYGKLEDEGNYYCKIMNGDMEVCSNTCHVNVIAKLKLLVGLTGTKEFNKGSTVKLSVSATAEGEISYNWTISPSNAKKDNITINGNTLTINNATSENEGTYICEVSSNGEKITSSVNLVCTDKPVVEPIIITKNLVSSNEVRGDSLNKYPTFEFGIEAKSAEGLKLNYEWHRVTNSADTIVKTLSTEPNIFKANKIFNNERVIAGDYYCIISDEKGNAIKSNVCKVSELYSIYDSDLSLKINNIDHLGSIGESVGHNKFNIKVLDNAEIILNTEVKSNEEVGTDFTYQWYKNDVLIPNETNNSLNINSFASENAGTYKCVVSNWHTYNGERLKLNEATSTILNLTLEESLMADYNSEAKRKARREAFYKWANENPLRVNQTFKLDPSLYKKHDIELLNNANNEEVKNNVMVTALHSNCPEIFWLFNKRSIYDKSIGNPIIKEYYMGDKYTTYKTASGTIEEIDTIEEINNFKAELEKVYTECDNIIKSKETEKGSPLTRREKVRIINKFICDKVTYDNETWNPNITENNYNSNGTSVSTVLCLVTGKGICGGFTAAFNALCNRQGIETESFCSDLIKKEDGNYKDTHIWNRVLVEKTDEDVANTNLVYLNVDVTANDGQINQNKPRILMEGDWVITENINQRLIFAD